MSPHISIIIPVYNAERFLQECLDSILNQDLKSLEIICVDDGSTDHSVEILNRNAQKDPRIHVLTQENQGAGAARNAGIQHAQGDFITFMDPDDYYPTQDILSTLYNNAITHNVKISGGSLAYLNENGIEPIPVTDKEIFSEDKLWQFNDYQIISLFPRFIYQREMILQNHIQFPLYRRFEDPPFMLQCMLSAQNFYATSKICYTYRRGHQNYKEFPKNQIIDWLHGLSDVFEISREKSLEKIHHRVVFIDMGTPSLIAYCQKLAAQGDYDVLPYLFKIQSNLNFDLLKRVNPRLKNVPIILPLKMLIESYVPLDLSSKFAKKYFKTYLGAHLKRFHK